jgi:aarF domain-containing kinase
MKENLPKELDFRIEAENNERLKSYLKPQQLRVFTTPRVEWAHERVLCMEFIDGARIDDVAFLKKNNISSTRVRNVLNDTFAQMIFIYGFLHADPVLYFFYILCLLMFSSILEMYLSEVDLMLAYLRIISSWYY